MENLVAQRIQSRLDALGKNPSGVALEAGLGRSSVRDILLGRVTNPRIDTLKRLTGPLQCSLDYLTGESSDPHSDGLLHMDVMMKPALLAAEAGVFRPVRKFDFETSQGGEHFPVTRDQRLPQWTVNPVRVLDNSMEEAHIVKGDILLVANHHYDLQIPLTNGTIVAVRQTLVGLELEEISVRQVEIRENGIHLVCRSPQQIPPISISALSVDNESTLIPNLYRAERSSVEVLGAVTRMIRELPISDAMYDLPHIPD